MIAIMICFCAVAVPLEVGYDAALRRSMGTEGWANWNYFNLAVDIIFIFDIILNFRTGFVIDGHLITGTRRIASHYIRHSFAIDVVGSFPINFIIEIASSGSTDEGQPTGVDRLNKQLRLLRIVKLNRLLRLSKLSKSFKARPTSA